MQRLEANSEKFRGSCFVIGSRKCLQDEFALHGIDGGAKREAQGREFGGGCGVSAAEVGGKMAPANEVAVTHNHGTLENVAQLANVSRPGITVKKLADFCVNTANLTGVFDIEVAQEVLDQHGQIFLAIA